MILSTDFQSELKSHVRDLGSLRDIDFDWSFPKVEFTPVAQTPGVEARPQSGVLMRCTFRDDSSYEFRVVCEQLAANHPDTRLVAELSPGAIVSPERREIASPVEIKGAFTQWIVGVLRSRTKRETIATKVGDLVAEVAQRLPDDNGEPFTEAKRHLLDGRLLQLNSWAIVLREMIRKTDPDARSYFVALTDAENDAKLLQSQWSELPRNQVMRWSCAIIARLDYVWRAHTGKTETHDMLAAFWQGLVENDFESELMKDYDAHVRLPL